MNRIDERFGKLAAEGKAAFIPFVTAGDPDLGTTERIILGIEKQGADIIELGFPFSDPVADGPVIQASYTRALSKGQRTEDIFRMVESVRQASQIPIVAMISYSLVFRMGFDGFLERACRAGMDGATIPDLPVEEMEGPQMAARERAFHLVCFVTPATTARRLSMIVPMGGGFIYYVSVRGITGVRDSLPPDLAQNIGRLKALTPVPVAVGFGISKPEHARAVAHVADGVIVGSALVKCARTAVERGADPVREVAELAGRLARAAKSEE